MDPLRDRVGFYDKWDIHVVGRPKQGRCSVGQSILHVAHFGQIVSYLFGKEPTFDDPAQLFVGDLHVLSVRHYIIGCVPNQEEVVPEHRRTQIDQRLEVFPQQYSLFHLLLPCLEAVKDLQQLVYDVVKGECLRTDGKEVNASREERHIFHLSILQT